MWMNPMNQVSVPMDIVVFSPADRRKVQVKEISKACSFKAGSDALHVVCTSMQEENYSPNASKRQTGE